MDPLGPEDETGQRIGLFFVGFSVAVLFALFGFLALPVTDADPSPHNEVVWSALVDCPLLATPWVVALSGVGVMAWTVFGRWSSAEELARREPAGGSAPASPDWARLRGWLRRRSGWLVVLATVLGLVTRLAR